MLLPVLLNQVLIPPLCLDPSPNLVVTFASIELVAICPSNKVIDRVNRIISQIRGKYAVHIVNVASCVCVERNCVPGGKTCNLTFRWYRCLWLLAIGSSFEFCLLFLDFRGIQRNVFIMCMHNDAAGCLTKSSNTPDLLLYICTFSIQPMMILATNHSPFIHCVHILSALG